MTAIEDSSIPDAKLLSLAELQRMCSEQDVLYHAGKASDPQYCMELFRRAFVAKEQTAWDVLHGIYLPLVSSWVRLQLGSTKPEQVEPLVNAAFFRFWKAITVEKFNTRLNHLGKLLQYLKTCAISCVIDLQRSEAQLRQQQHVDDAVKQLASSEPFIEMLISERVSAENLWQWVWEQLNSDEERIVAESAFCYELSPAQIYSAHPNRFADVKRVYRLQENILKRLRRKAQTVPL